LERLRSIQIERLVVCRELTKKFETIYRGNINEIISQLNKDKNQLKGEFAIVLWNQ